MRQSKSPSASRYKCRTRTTDGEERPDINRMKCTENRQLFIYYLIKTHLKIIYMLLQIVLNQEKEKKACQPNS